MQYLSRSIGKKIRKKDILEFLSYQMPSQGAKQRLFQTRRLLQLINRQLKSSLGKNNPAVTEKTECEIWVLSKLMA